MAFIDGYITRWECPLCGLGCKPKLKKRKPGGKAEFVYVHAEGVPTEVNGYPAVCDNAWKELTLEEVNVIRSPNYVKIPGTFA